MDFKNKKCLKKTTYVQFQKLVDLMEEFPQLATGSPSFGSNKATVEQTWDAVAEKVNALGPPTRSGCEWKKVWHDQKCRLKKKISENNKSLHGTGGGPCAINNLTDMELHIDRICHLSSAGAPGGKFLGYSSTKQIVELTPPRTHVKVAVVTPTTSKGINEHQKYQQLPEIFVPNISNVITLEDSPLKTQTRSQQSLLPSQQTTLSSTKQTQDRPKVEVTRPFYHNRKRKNIEINSDKQKFAYQRMEVQNKTLEVLNKQLEATIRSTESAKIQAEAAKTQAEAAKIQAEATKEQATALKEIADSSKVMAQCLVDIIKHLKDED